MSGKIIFKEVEAYEEFKELLKSKKGFFFFLDLY